MKNYVYIFHYDTPTLKPSDTAMEAWGKWFEGLGDRIVDSGNPFHPTEQAQIIDGKVNMEPDSACGYTVVKATDLKEAVTMAMTCPLAIGTDCSVRVYETMPM